MDKEICVDCVQNKKNCWDCKLSRDGRVFAACLFVCLLAAAGAVRGQCSPFFFFSFFFFSKFGTITAVMIIRDP